MLSSQSRQLANHRLDKSNTGSSQIRQQNQTAQIVQEARFASAVVTFARVRTVLVRMLGTTTSTQE